MILRQVPTAWNIADPGTKCLTTQRLLVLVHEAGLVFVEDFAQVGVSEYHMQRETGGSRTQIKKIANTIFRMSVATGLEPVVAPGEVLVVDNQQCAAPMGSSSGTTSWTFGVCIFLSVLLIAMLGGALWWMWKKIKLLLHDSYRMSNHYEFDVELETRIAMAEDMIETVRYGLMEFGGFVRVNELTGEQRQSMYVQERGNFVVWRLKHEEAETTDSPEAAGEEHGGGTS